MHWQATAHLEVNMRLLLVSGAQHARWMANSASFCSTPLPLPLSLPFSVPVHCLEFVSSSPSEPVNIGPIVGGVVVALVLVAIIGIVIIVVVIM